MSAYATGAVILAGGRSRRMGRAKGLVAFQGGTLLGWQVERLHDAGLAPVIVVAGLPEYDAVLAELPVTHVGQPDLDAPQFASLQRGLRALPCGVGCVVVPVDAPLVATVPWAVLCGGSQSAARLCYHGVPGHPVWLSAGLVARLVDVDPLTHRLDHLLRDLDKVLHVEVDTPDILRNLNTPADLLGSG